RRGCRRSCVRDDLLAEVDLVAALGAGRLERRFQLFLFRQLADDAEAAVGAVDAIRRAAAPSRPVDEVLGELGGRRGSGLRGRDELVERAPELLDAGAGRTRQGEDAQDPRILA